MMFAWIGAGVNTLTGETSGETSASDPGLLERTSLLHLVLLVQSTTPDSIPYLDGETYAILPSTIIPRFLDPEKTANQSPLRLLSIRYNLESAYDPSTSIGWGLIAEAYANFGRLGVIVIGAIIGGICGALMRLSIGASTMSSPMLVTIASTAVLMNLEATFANLLTALAQSAAAAFVVAEILKFDRRQKR